MEREKLERRRSLIGRERTRNKKKMEAGGAWLRCFTLILNNKKFRYQKLTY